VRSIFLATLCAWLLLVAAVVYVGAVDPLGFQKAAPPLPPTAYMPHGVPCSLPTGEPIPCDQIPGAPPAS
jgi:hypothetical protein